MTTAAFAKINKPVLVLMTTLATAIGITPWVLFVRSPGVLIGLTAGALLVSGLAIRKFNPHTTEAPGFSELLLGFVASISLPAQAGCWGLLSYAATDLLARSVRWFLSKFGWETWIDANLIALGVSSFSVGYLAIAFAALTVRRLGMQLYPEAAGLRSAFYSLAASRRLLGFLMVALLAIAVSLLVALRVQGAIESWAFSSFLSAVLCFMGLPFERFGMREVPEESNESETIRAVKELFEAGDYEVISRPRTGREDIDPLLVTSPDLYAESAERGFAIEVKASADEAEALDRGALSDLSSAAWALGKFFKEESEGQGKPVYPLLVLVGLDPPRLVRDYQVRDMLCVLSIDDKQFLGEFLNTTDKEKRAAMASHYLQYLRATSTCLQLA
jgi:hypothetical protein